MEKDNAFFCTLEGAPAVEHGYGAGFAVVTIPAAKACANPSGVGERAFGVRVLLLERFAFEIGVEGFQKRLVFWLKRIGDGAQRAFRCIAVAGMDQLLHDDSCDKHRHHHIA